jgi:hypothetical protein
LLIALLTGGYAIFKSARVQTYLIKKITTFWAQKLNTKIQIESIDVEFFDKLVLKNLYIEDHGQDTLLFAPEFKITVTDLNFNHQLFQLGDIILQDAYINIRKFKRGSDFNFQFLLDALGKQSSNSTKSKGAEVLCNSISLKNCRLNYSLLYKKHANWGIDWDYIKLKNLNVTLSSFHSYSDTINTYINHLSFVENSGFYISDASCFFKAHSKKMYFKNFEASTKNSNFVATINFKYNSWSDFDDFIERVNIYADIKRSKIELEDISYFAQELKGLKKQVYIKANVEGKINNFTANPILLEFGEKTSIEGKLKMEGLPDAENTLINFKIKNLYTNKNDLEGIPIPPFYKNKFIHLPSEVSTMGTINYTGDFTGFYNDFVTYGTIKSNIGTARTDIKIKYNESEDMVSYSGKIETQNLNLSTLLNNSYLGIINANLTLNGKGFSIESLSALAKGKINQIDINNYRYSNITIDGSFKNKVFMGNCSINDPNIALNFNGLINLNPKETTFNFDANIDHADLNALSLYKINEPFNISTKLEVDAIGNTLDDFKGTVSIDAIKINTAQNEYELGDIIIHSQEIDKRQKKLLITSDIVDLRLTGIYQFQWILTDLKKLIHYYYPNLFNNEVNKTTNSTENFSFTVNLKNTSAISHLFFPAIKLAENTYLSGNFNNTNNRLTFKSDIPQLTLYNINLSKIQTDIESNTTSFSIKNQIHSAQLNNDFSIKNITISASPYNSALSTIIQWDNQQKLLNEGYIESFIHFNTNSTTDINISTVNFFINDTNWTSTKSGNILIDTNHINFSNVELNTNSQKITINGEISPDPTKLLTISFNHFIIANLNPLLSKYDLELNGFSDGKLTINNVYQNPIFNTSLNFKDFTLNNENFGNGEVIANYDDSRKNIKISGDFLRGKLPTIMFNGIYFPFKTENDLDFSINLNKTQLKILQRFTSDVLSDLKGYATGDIQITGSSLRPELFGKIDIERGGFKIIYLNTTYSFNGVLAISPQKFEVNNAELYDEQGNRSSANFKLLHNNFKDFSFDISVNANNLQCLNTTLKNNNLFYGNAFASGLIKIYGPTDKITIDAAVKTNKGTQLYIPYNGSTEVNEKSFVKFVSKDSSQIKLNKLKQTDLTGVQMNLDLEVTPEAAFQMVFDSKVGDVLRGKGNGNIQMNINTHGLFTMYGEFIFSEGDYLFTFENTINKKFKIEPGSMVTWTGNPYNANINVTSVYKTKTSLATLLQDSSSQYKRNIPVEVILKLTDKLFSPTISFGINFPTQTNNETLKAQVNTIIGNENNNELNRQVFALLVIGSFIPPAGSSAGATRVTEGIGNSSAELLSAQFNNWISQLSKGVNLGVNYKPASSTGFTSNQIELAVSTQLFDNRLTIDGNVGVANRQQSAAASSLVDVNIEYKLTNNGKLRLKAYNKPNDFINYFTQGYNRQGVGLIYGEEFNNLRELFHRNKQKPLSSNANSTNQNTNNNPTPEPKKEEEE